MMIKKSLKGKFVGGFVSVLVVLSVFGIATAESETFGILNGTNNNLISENNDIVLSQSGNVKATVVSTSASGDAAFGMDSPTYQELFSSCQNSVGQSVDVGYFSAGTEMIFYADTTWEGKTYLSTDPSHCRVTEISTDVWQLGWEDWVDDDFDDFIIQVASTSINLSDLTLTSADISFSNPNPKEGETITINAAIHNIGNSDASSVVVQFFEGDPVKGTQKATKPLKINAPKTAHNERILNINETKMSLSTSAKNMQTNGWLVNLSDPTGDASPPGYDIVNAYAKNDVSTFFMEIDLDGNYVSEAYSGYAVRIYVADAIYGLGFCTYSAYWGPHLVVSYDGGQTWQEASGSFGGSANGNVITAWVDISDIGSFPWTIDFVSGIVFSPYSYEVKDSTCSVIYPPAELKPDLTLASSDISFSNPNPPAGEKIAINATIHNVGDTDTSDVIVQFLDGEPTIGTQIGTNQTIDLITAGGRETVSVEWTADAGTHDIYVVVDPDDQIEECNEDNNIAFKTISILSPEIANLMALEEEFYKKSLETIDLQGDNLARITADCIIDAFSLSINQLLADDDFINELAEKLNMDKQEVIDILDSEDFKKAEGKVEEEARGILYEATKTHFVEPLTKDQKDSITSVHQAFLTYMSTHADEFSTDRIKECEEGLKVNIDALEEAQRFNTGSWNPFERLPFVYLGDRPYQINSVSMAVCGYDWADSSYLAKFASIVYQISGGGVGELITGFGIKPGVVLAAFSAIGCDAYNIYAGYSHVFSAIKEEMLFHKNLIDDSCTTPVSLISSLLSCPANLHAYDSQGRHVGLNETGGIEVEIPNASYYHNSTTNTTEIVIFDSNDTISFEVNAFSTGKFNLTNVQGTNETHTTIAYQNISMETENTTATVGLNATSANYTLNLDSDGDDIVDDVLSPNSTAVNHFPNASIISPKNGMNITKGQSIAFEGSGTDEEDGELSGSSLIWISSIDGIIGTGCSFRLSNLSSGNHTVSLTAIDDGGLADVSRVSITVLPNCWCDTFDNTDKIAFSNNTTVSGGDVKIKAISWYYSDWNYRKQITVTNNNDTANLTDYQVLVNLTSTNFNFSRANSDGNDTRFTYWNSTSQTETNISYGIEKWNSTSEEALIWVKVPFVPANGNATVYMYYGNTDAVSASDGNATFLVFDDFLGSSLSSNWDTSGVTDISVSNSVASMIANTWSSRSLVWTPQTFDDVCIEAREKSCGTNPLIGTVARKGYSSGNSWSNQYFTHLCSVIDGDLSWQAIGKNIGATNIEITGNNDYALSNDVWYITKFYLYGTNIKNELYNDSSGDIIQCISGTDSTFSSGYIGLVVWYSDKTAYFDWIRVRKYTDPEPTTSVGAEETKTYSSAANLTSIAITPSSLQTWDKFYANDTLPEGTNITYKILNASDNSTFCTINSTQANAGYCISECASGVDLIRLYTELTTTNASLTPVLHDWNVSWIPEVTPTLTITQAQTDKTTYKLNESVTISCAAQNETGQNISADVVFASITNPDGYFEQMSMDEGLVGRYNGTFTNTSLTGVYNVTIYANKTGYVNDTAKLSFEVVSGPAVFDTGPGGYPSIRGTHKGTITPSHVITVTKMYTYPCFKTGGHSEFVTFFNSSTGDEIANGTWIGTYLGNYQWIEFSEPFTLKVGVTYNYTIITGSYPQIHHTDALLTANGWINCTKFTDANGRVYKDWIPAIRLWS